MQHVTTKPRIDAVETASQPGIVDRYEQLVEDGLVEVTPAPEAIVCSALGCHEHDRLLDGYVEGFGQRILCGLHLAKLIRRELIDDE
jgi:hypothetical protein